jgi:hypothetical protein
MSNVSSDITSVDQVGQDTFDFVQVHWSPEEAKGLNNRRQRYLRLANDQTYPLEEVSVAEKFALFQEEVGALTADQKCG